MPHTALWRPSRNKIFLPRKSIKTFATRRRVNFEQIVAGWLADHLFVICLVEAVYPDLENIFLMGWCLR
jgi:hypothetical protein